MSVALNSDQVVEDYKSSLLDLTQNNKHEINLLTVIASEYIGKAVELSRVLETHIRNVPPDRKLPAFYVLDSIAKNVGGAYTRCLGQNLYHTFMNAYASVQAPIRKKLDEMVKTWKEPVPGSSDMRPVFPPEITRPIETNLIKFRTLAFQAAQQQQRQQGPPMPQTMNSPYAAATFQPDWRNTATPPQHDGYYPPANSQVYPQPNGYPQRSHYPSNNQFPPPQPTPPTFQPPYQPPTPHTYQSPPTHDLGSLHRDIDNLISTTKLEFAARHWDTGLQTRLKALLDLQSIMRNQQLPPNQIQAIRDQVSQLAQTQPPATPVLTQQPVSMPLPIPVPTPTPSAYPAPAPSTAQPSADIQRFLDSNALAEILASAARAKQGTPVPSIPPSVPPPTNSQITAPSPQPKRISTPSSNTTSLLENLKALGMLMPDTSMPNGALPTAQPSSHLPSSHQNSFYTSPAQPTSLAPARPQALQNDAELSNASLKIPRPDLIRAKLFEARPNQCSTCAQRFSITEEGKKEKARHLDLHFRYNRRPDKSSKVIYNRSWYVDEMEWIRSRDDLDGDPEDGKSSQAKAAEEAAKNDPRNKTVPAPSDPILRNVPCPVCQDKFEPSWDVATQDFVWRDAIEIGSRVYHASCHAEIKKNDRKPREVQPYLLPLLLPRPRDPGSFVLMMRVNPRVTRPFWRHSSAFAGILGVGAVFGREYQSHDLASKFHNLKQIRTHIFNNMSSALPRYNHIISKYSLLILILSSTAPPFAPQSTKHTLIRLDPLFALTIGTAAATLRVRREEREKGESGELGDIGAKMWRRCDGWWRGDYGGRMQQEER
ncbi:MAG: hypothetical protein L6R40_005593 [Gallowayella cf. fulva]|nr:MAG: hypothetical protein L6R40_005593 [Xanthomendoza cf. fulva]